MSRIMKLLSNEEIKKLSTQRLLAYYKAYAYTWRLKYECDCCGDPLWKAHPELIHRKVEFDAMSDYFKALKTELDGREHIAKERSGK